MELRLAELYRVESNFSRQVDSTERGRDRQADLAFFQNILVVIVCLYIIAIDGKGQRFSLASNPILIGVFSCLDLVVTAVCEPGIDYRFIGFHGGVQDVIETAVRNVEFIPAFGGVVTTDKADAVVVGSPILGNYIHMDIIIGLWIINSISALTDALQVEGQETVGNPDGHLAEWTISKDGVTALCNLGRIHDKL